MRVVIFSGGEITRSQLIEQTLVSVDKIIAADGGANAADALGIVPDIVVGDMDSIQPVVRKKLEKKSVQFISHPQEKDETDTELALDYALKSGATEITILGGNEGTRFDHVMANILLALTCPILLRFVNGNQISWIEKGPISRSISGKKGDLLSLIPVAGNVRGIILQGLQYMLQNETLLLGKPRGVSNVFTSKTATVRLGKGSLLIVHTVV